MGPLADQAPPCEAGILLSIQKSRVPTLKLPTTQTVKRHALVGEDERVGGVLGGNRSGERVLRYSGLEGRHNSWQSEKLCSNWSTGRQYRYTFAPDGTRFRRLCATATATSWLNSHRLDRPEY